ncbi:MAG TPA: TrkA C-terminal domain-containing protein [Gemmatimonadaceae bacterium]|nr:TrkA C-terminal domain-containing protein [Gemmatimonadaceae bacterium]
MAALLSLLLVLALSYLVIRVGAVALGLTGISSEVARFQAQSAFFGVGFTTRESEQVLAHPVRRRIVMLLMIGGNAGVVASVTSVLLVFVTEGRAENRLAAAAGILAGVALLWRAARTRWADQHLSRLVEWALRRWTSLDVRDYVSLLHLAGEYAVIESAVHPESWFADHTLAELNLRAEGALVLGIERVDGGFIGAPRGPTRVAPGDVLILYGRAPLLDELDRRPAGPAGDRAHRAAVAARRGESSDAADAAGGPDAPQSLTAAARTAGAV